jgi:hypothetical protein
MNRANKVGESGGDMDQDRSGGDEVGKAVEFSRRCGAQVRGARRGELGLIPSWLHLYTPLRRTRPGCMGLKGHGLASAARPGRLAMGRIHWVGAWKARANLFYCFNFSNFLFLFFFIVDQIKFW